MSSSLPSSPLGFLNAGPFEMLLLAVIALLLFGGDLPEVARTWGKYFGEFRRHVDGIRQEFHSAMYAADHETPRLGFRREPAVDAVEAAVAESTPVEAVDPDAGRALEGDAP